MKTSALQKAKEQRLKHLITETPIYPLYYKKKRIYREEPKAQKVNFQ